MEILIIVVVVAAFLIREKIQQNKAQDYADKVVRRHSKKK